MLKTNFADMPLQPMRPSRFTKAGSMKIKYDRQQKYSNDDKRQNLIKDRMKTTSRRAKPKGDQMSTINGNEYRLTTKQRQKLAKAYTSKTN